MRSLPGHARKHGHSHDKAGGREDASPTYRSWASMIQRCTNPKFASFAAYGARGIKVCTRWRRSFRCFLRDMGERPAGTSLDRFPNRRGNYEPGNCRWATRREQRLNSDALHLLTFNGETLPLKHWAIRLGLKRATLSNRILYRGWSVERALTSTVADGIAAKVESGRVRQRDPLTQQFRKA